MSSDIWKIWSRFKKSIGLLQVHQIIINMFNKYENYLNGVEEGCNYWSDIGISEAIEILEKFSDNDWQLLEDKIQTKSEIWLVSCAETLGDNVGGVREFEVLLKLLSNESDDVKIAAIDAINSCISLGFDVGENSKQIRDAIEVLRPSAGVVVTKVLNYLEQQLDNL